ncbi:MAG TPA: hypothetical protein PK210_04895 [Bacteroidia bacterium]|nr:hypothetical protein [Bacteroidia bacterium]
MKEQLEILKNWVATGQVKTARGRQQDDLLTLIAQMEVALHQQLGSGSLPTKDVKKVMRWLLGYAPSFPSYTEGSGMYYWRKALRVKIKRELKMVIGNNR